MNRQERRFKTYLAHKRFLKELLNNSWRVCNVKMYARKNFNNKANCSCPMCCNERKNPWNKKKISLQERKHKDPFNTQMQEIHQWNKNAIRR